MNLRRRLERVESRVFAPSAPDSPLAIEVREIDRNIKKLTAEIAEAEAGMTLEELARSRAEQEESRARLEGLELDEQIRVLEVEIALLEAEGEGDGR